MFFKTALFSAYFTYVDSRQGILKFKPFQSWFCLLFDASHYRVEITGEKEEAAICLVFHKIAVLKKIKNHEKLINSLQCCHMSWRNDFRYFYIPQQNVQHDATDFCKCSFMKGVWVSILFHHYEVDLGNVPIGNFFMRIIPVRLEKGVVW